MTLIYAALGIILSLLTQAHAINSNETLENIIQVLSQVLSVELLITLLVIELIGTIFKMSQIGILHGLAMYTLKLAAVYGCLYVSVLNMNFTVMDNKSTSMKITTSYNTTSIYADEGFLPLLKFNTLKKEHNE